MEVLILGVNTLYRLFCLFKLFPMVGKGLTITVKVCVQLLSIHDNKSKGDVWLLGNCGIFATEVHAYQSILVQRYKHTVYLLY